MENLEDHEKYEEIEGEKSVVVPPGIEVCIPNKTYSEDIIVALRMYLKKHYDMSDDRIEEIVDEYLIQDFYGKLIHLCDGGAGQSGIIVETDASGKETVIGMCPMLDLDFSLWQGLQMEKLSLSVPLPKIWAMIRELNRKDLSSVFSEEKEEISTMNVFLNDLEKYPSALSRIENEIRRNFDFYRNYSKFIDSILEQFGDKIDDERKARKARYKESLEQSFKDVYNWARTRGIIPEQTANDQSKLNGLADNEFYTNKPEVEEI